MCFRTLRHIRYITNTSLYPRTLCTSSPQPNQPPPPPSPLLPPSNQLQSALTTLSTIPELPQALSTPSPQLSQTLLNRVLEITQSLSGSHSAIVHSLLAKLHHSLGNLSYERTLRLKIISSLSQTPPDPSDAELHGAHIAAAHLSLALCCLRGTGAEARLAATAAAASAQRLAAHPVLRTCATLAAAMSDGPDVRGTRTMLSALVAVQRDLEEGVPDVPGFARAFLALWGDDLETRTDHAKALVVRWEGRGGFDFIEALCLTGRTLMQTGVKTDLDMAEDMFSRAVRVAGEVGGELDKGEGLLGLARVYERMGRPVEAEGMFRSVEERFDVMWRKKRFTVAAAELYCRAMERYADFLSRSEVNGLKRTKEGELRTSRADEVRQLFSEVLSGESCAPLWTVESLLPSFELPVPPMEESR